jgi:hypothetical protein
MSEDPDELITCALISAWSRLLGIPQSTLRRRLKNSPFVMGQLPNSTRLAKGYPEEEVRRLCADLIDPDFVFPVD